MLYVQTFQSNGTEFVCAIGWPWKLALDGQCRVHNKKIKISRDQYIISNGYKIRNQ